MKKYVLGLGTLAMVGSLFLTHPGEVSAQENHAPRSEVGTYGMSLLASGELEGRMTPYIQGVPKSGNIAQHYTAKSTVAIGLFDKSNLVVKLPDEFKYVALQDEFKRAIKGSITYPTGMGAATHEYTAGDITIYADRIVLKNPRASYIFGAKFTADLSIDYGAILDKYPNIPIDENPSGYSFVAVLTEDAMIDCNLIGSKEGRWISEETAAIRK
ncbi:hypothetical protein HB852_12180 [Listeria grandensis]|uniref:Secreted protein n=2 Tax=Listeria grandensis TaxID=1494963 RepID=A0A7X1CQ09_9LIST|nr:hypothetical protein [Listeria grandensis]EUJ23736.1 putative secreted protein [Listeria grandensis FSL F6-0971]MBC1475371.1 hypothetical protein [Listeria grandensis]MBC1936536.1 hypothetical protein [Listeria grandensis]MBC6316232.1 hypothetical protein [Listeria grandensis]